MTGIALACVVAQWSNPRWRTAPLWPVDNAFGWVMAVVAGAPLGLWLNARLEGRFPCAARGEALDAHRRRAPMLIPSGAF